MEKVTNRMDFYDRIHIFASYLGATVRIRNTEKWGSLRGVVGDKVCIQLASSPNAFDPQQEPINNTEVVLLLKPLGCISKEDAVQVAKILDLNPAKGVKLQDCYLIGTKEVVKFAYDFDNKEIALLLFSKDGSMTICERTKKRQDFDLWLQVGDFLRASGYALPYGCWSVEQLEEFGIYKLITE